MKYFILTLLNISLCACSAPRGIDKNNFWRDNKKSESTSETFLGRSNLAPQTPQGYQGGNSEKK